MWCAAQHGGPWSQSVSGSAIKLIDSIFWVSLSLSLSWLDSDAPYEEYMGLYINGDECKESDAAVLLNSFPPHPVDSGRFGESVNYTVMCPSGYSSRQPLRRNVESMVE